MSVNEILCFGWVDRCCTKSCSTRSGLSQSNTKSGYTYAGINVWAILVHLFNTLAMLWAWFDASPDQISSGRISLTETVEIWSKPEDNCTVLSGENWHERMSIDSGKVFCTQNQAIASELSPTIDLWWTIILFHALSFVFQLVATSVEWDILYYSECCASFGSQDSLSYDRRLAKRKRDTETMELMSKSSDPPLHYSYAEYVDRGLAPFRYIEYSISATLMLISVAVLCGVKDWASLIGVAVCCSACMIFGFISDQIRKTNLSLAWFSHFFGWVTIASSWFVIFRTFFLQVSKFQTSYPNSEQGMPWFVYVIVFSLFGLFNGFGLTSVIQLCLTSQYSERKELLEDEKQFNRNIEFAFVMQSLISKTFLGWFIFANLLVAP